MIRFTYKGQEYELPDEAGKVSPVSVVMDKDTLVFVKFWRVQPGEIQQIPTDDISARTAEELRNMFCADYIATKVSDKPRRSDPSQEWAETIGKMLVDNGFGDL